MAFTVKDFDEHAFTAVVLETGFGIGRADEGILATRHDPTSDSSAATTTKQKGPMSSMQVSGWNKLEAYRIV